jgi:hypothetical protein
MFDLWCIIDDNVSVGGLIIISDVCVADNLEVIF